MRRRRNSPAPAVTTEVFEFEPDETTVLGALLPHSLNFRVYQILLEARASEHSARMVAMKNATDNAKQLIKGSDARIQQIAPVEHHEGTVGNRHRANGGGLKSFRI